MKSNTLISFMFRPEFMWSRGSWSQGAPGFLGLAASRHYGRIESAAQMARIVSSWLKPSGTAGLGLLA